MSKRTWIYVADDDEIPKIQYVKSQKILREG